MSPAESGRFEELCSRYLDAVLTAGEQVELLQFMDNPDLGRSFCELITLDREIAGVLIGPICSGKMFALVEGQIRQDKTAEAAWSKAVMVEIREASSHRSLSQSLFEKFCRWAESRLGGVWNASSMVGVAVAVVLVILGIGMAFIPGAPQGIAKIEFVEGGAYVIGQSGRIPLKPGQPLQEGEGIETRDRDSAAGFRFADGTLVVLYEGTRISGLSMGAVPKPGILSGGKNFFLQKGSITAQVAHQPSGRPLLVRTSTADAKVLGTTLNLSSGDNQTRLEVLKGQVELIRKEDGASVQTRAGFSAAVSEGTTELALRPLLPSPWVSRDIGNSLVAGSARYENGLFTVRGSGEDIWKNADSFQFVHQTTNGDCEIIARVIQSEITASNSKAGIMLRETLEQDSKDAVFNVNPAYGNVGFYYREAAGGMSKSAGYTPRLTPCWVRLVRKGDVFTGYFSSDGLRWQFVGTQTIKMASVIQAGLAVTSFNNGVLNTSTFDQVIVR